MCGIAGYFGFKKPPAGMVERTRIWMEKRGPDAFQEKSFLKQGNHIVLLHSRLSIIDLDARANQPMSIGGKTIVLNGEIYNYRELRKELEGKGVRFKTTSDTEVLLQSYIVYGKDCVERFEGMWAFAIYDEFSGELFLSRDRFGEKPLWYYREMEGFYFASETNMLSAMAGRDFEVNEKHLLRYLVNGHKSLFKSGEHFYKKIKEIPSRHCMVINPGLESRTYDYWNPEVKEEALSEKECIEKTRELIINSVSLRLRADVPVAFCLSGGVDSSSLVSVASKIFNYDVTSFSILDPDPRYDESTLIRETVSDTGIKNFSMNLHPDQGHLARLKDLVRYHDAPVSTISYLVHSYLSEEISKRGFKIAVSGTGADELFTGYYDHFILHLAEMEGTREKAECLKDWENHIKPLARHPDFQNPELYVQQPRKRDHIYLQHEVFETYLLKPFHEAFSETAYHPRLLKNRMLNELFHEVVPVILREDDLNSMMYSVENRSPFLDTGLFRFAQSIPVKFLIKKGFGKYILRSAMEGILNDKVRWEREKRGFNADIKSLFNLHDPEMRQFLLDDGLIFSYVSKPAIEKLLSMENYPNSFKKFLFNFVNARIFLELKVPKNRG